MIYQLQYSQYSERSILIEWPSIIDENILQDVLRYKKVIENNCIKEKVEVINTYCSIIIIYNFTIDKLNDRILELKANYKSENKVQKLKPKIWKIPVCYDDEFGVDMDTFSKEKKLSKSKIISLHSSTIYTVYFIGFLPGFLYLGGLNSRLFLDRKTTPKLNVKKGSVAIGGQQTGIYPQDSPGGWHIIGNSPIELFNAKLNPPCAIKAGDKIKFHPIEIEAYYSFKKSIEDSSFQLKSLKHD